MLERELIMAFISDPLVGIMHDLFFLQESSNCSVLQLAGFEMVKRVEHVEISPNRRRLWIWYAFLIASFILVKYKQAKIWNHKIS